MHQTPLRSFHEQFGATFVEYAGWEMPISYTSIHAEHRQVRRSGGIFDVSHMGRVRVAGRHARRLLERVCTRRITDMQTGQCRYSLVCNERGGVRDDVIVMRQDEDEFLVVVNAANREKILEHVQQVREADQLKAEVEDQTFKTAMVALQGPSVIEEIGRISSEVPTLKRYRFTVKNLMVLKLIVARTGYTGEDGVEVILPASAVSMAMKLLLKDIDTHSPDAPIKPAGLGARDTLRLEAGMPLYGHELGEQINALSCGVDFAISLDKDQDERGAAFIGMEALKDSAAGGGPQRLLVGMALEGKRTARQGMGVTTRGGKAVGEVSSACLSPTLERPIAMGFLDVEQTEPGTSILIDAGKRQIEGEVVRLPFYKRPK